MSNPLTQPATTVDEPRVNRESWRRLLLAAAGFAVAAFVVAELMHYLLVPDFGPYRERLIAEGASALILGVLAAKLLHGAYRARQHTLARLRVIAEVNHHVRNALEVISLSAYITRDEEAIGRIMEGVNRIDWALREILPRESFPPSGGGLPLESGPNRGSSTSPGARTSPPESYGVSPPQSAKAGKDIARSVL